MIDTTIQNASRSPALQRRRPHRGEIAIAGAPEGALAGDARDPADDFAIAEGEAAQAAAIELGAVESTIDPARRSTKLLADLVAAMRVAASGAHASTVEQLRVDAASAVARIRDQAPRHAAAARERSDTDVATVREWSMLELARIQAETEERIDARGRALDQELTMLAVSQHEAIEEVRLTAAAFEAELAAYFEHLAEEEAPARFAALAGDLPMAPAFPSWPPPESGALPISFSADDHDSANPEGPA